MRPRRGKETHDAARYRQNVFRSFAGHKSTETLGYGPDSVSVAIEDVPPRDWIARVYEPDIAAKPDQLFKEPGYGPGDL
ncbi:MAG: hypothetical protein WAU68_15065 [Vitreimonas sp.]